jgi:hypothetical protein
MEDFERMMGMEGVRPLERPKEKTRRRPAKDPRQVDSPVPAAKLEAEAVGYAWVTGSRARTALETALDRLAIEVSDGRRGWATGIHQDGTAVTLPASSGAASLLGTADRQSLRLMILGGEGWTFVMHPLMGVATLDKDPGSSK